MARIFGRSFGFSDLSGLSMDIGLSIRGSIRNTHVMLLNAGVRVPEPTHGPISRHFWSTSWSDFWSDFLIFDFPRFECRFPPADQAHHSQRPRDATDHQGTRLVAHPWPDFSAFMVRMVVGFLSDFWILGFDRFECRFRPADQVHHSQQPCDAFGRISNSFVALMQELVGFVFFVYHLYMPSRGNHG